MIGLLSLIFVALVWSRWGLAWGIAALMGCLLLGAVVTGVHMQWQIELLVERLNDREDSPQ